MAPSLVTPSPSTVAASPSPANNNNNNNNPTNVEVDNVLFSQVFHHQSLQTHPDNTAIAYNPKTQEF